MSKPKPLYVHCDTLGKIAKYYGYCVPVLITLINAYQELGEELNLHIKDYKNKGLKILPPSLVDKIIDKLGEP